MLVCRCFAFLFFFHRPISYPSISLPSKYDLITISVLGCGKVWCAKLIKGATCVKGKLASTSPILTKEVFFSGTFFFDCPNQIVGIPSHLRINQVPPMFDGTKCIPVK